MAFWYKGLPQGGGRVERQDINYLMLFDVGDECTDVTGGWKIEKYGTGTGIKQSDYLDAKCTASNGTDYAWFYTNNMIFKGYHLLIASVTGVASMDSVAGAFGLSSNQNGSPDFNSAINTKVKFFNLGKALYSMDISNVINCYAKFGTGNLRNAFLHTMCLVKTDDWQTWLIRAGLIVSHYASLDAVIADSSALTILMSSEAAVNYMLYHCTGTVMAAVIQSQAALKVIEDSPYNARIFANPHWNKFLRMVGVVPESDKLYLYDGGFCDGTTALVNRRPDGTGGILTYTAECINLTMNPNDDSGCGWWSFAAYDFSPYKKMRAIASAVTYTPDHADNAQFNISVNYNGSLLGVHNFIIKDTGGKITDMEIDVSNITQLAYPSIGMYVATAKYYKIWLEK